MKVAICLNATNDRNGNPRRCYVVFDTAKQVAIDCIDDNYEGKHALTSRYPKAVYLGEFATVPSEYRDSLRQWSQLPSDIERRERERKASQRRFDKLLAERQTS